LKSSYPTNSPQIGLASWLGGGSVVVVLIAVVAMAIACAVLLNRAVQQQALMRVQLAATSARELMRRVGEDVLTDAQVLAERPTLLRLLQQKATNDLLPFISRYCESSGNNACAVRGPEMPLLSNNAALPWDEVAVANREHGERFLLAPRDGQAPWWGATVAVNGMPGYQVQVLRQATPLLVNEIGKQTNTQLTLSNYAVYRALPDDPLTTLHGMALGNGHVSAGHLSGSDEFSASVTVTTVTGEVVALLDARVSGAEFSSASSGFNRLLALIAVVVALVAGVGGLLYGRWLARPVIVLRDVAQRIGRGDLSAAVPAFAPLEVGSLARSMDEMRRNLVTLTESLRRREAEAQALLGGIVEGVFAVDSERQIRYVNPQILKMLGKPASEIIGRFCGDVLLPAHVNGKRPCESNCPILAARSAGQASARESLCVADGSTRSTIIVSAAPVAGTQVQVLRDETELEAVRRARDSVLANISHEFRTPLAAQLASIELLRDGLASMPHAAQSELLANVERGVLRLMRLIDNLLESVRIEAGQLAIRQQQVELAEVVQEAVDLLAPLLAQRRLQIDVQLLSVDTAILGDAQRLLQVFVNLLSNAAKFAPEGSTIAIGARKLAGAVEVWVDDTGAGIAAGSGAAIFERFRRAEGSEPDAPGLGLGLWIVKSIIDRHGGSIVATRTADEHTRFILTLPLEASP
jgi:signal transduction histidine kinase/HAMP domain-containing protein